MAQSRKKLAKKKVAKKIAKKTASNSANATAALPQSANIPEGMKQMGGGYAPTWKPEEIGDALHGAISGIPREVEFKQGRKTVQRRVMEITDMEGARHAVWESAALGALFDEMTELGEDAEGTEVYLHFDGLGKKKAGQNPPKLFTVATA